MVSIFKGVFPDGPKENSELPKVHTFRVPLFSLKINKSVWLIF